MLNERKQVIKDILYEVMFFVIAIVALILLHRFWLDLNFFLTMLLGLVAVGFPCYRLSVYEHTRLISPNYVGADAFELNFVSRENLMNRVKVMANYLGYKYESNLETFYDEFFTLFTKENPDEVKFSYNKIGVYSAKKYIAETYINSHGIEYGEDLLYSRKKLAEVRPPYKKIYKLVCGKWGRRYFLPKEWVPMEMILIVLIDEWSYSTDLLLYAAEQLPFVLFTVINVNEPNVIYVAKDNRKEKKEDYIIKKQELFTILGISGQPVEKHRFSDDGNMQL